METRADSSILVDWRRQRLTLPLATGGPRAQRLTSAADGAAVMASAGKAGMTAPLSLAGIFGGGSDGEDGDDGPSAFTNEAATTEIELAGERVLVSERPFHPLNANAVWPGTYVLAAWLREHVDLLRGRRVLELGSATGALAVLMTRLHLDVTTSDVDDGEVVEQARSRDRQAALKRLARQPRRR